MRIGIFFAILLTASASAQTCSVNAAQQSLAEAHAIQAKLFAIPEPKEDLPLDAPPAARSGVPALLNSLASVIERYMDCEAKANTPPTEIEQQLSLLLGANGPNLATDRRNGYPDYTYGDSLTLHVKPLSSKSDVLAIDLSFSIGCGDNHMLLLFRRTEQAWRKVINWHSNKYTQPSDAFGDFFVYALVSSPTDDPLVAIAYGTPWCSSRMSGFHVDLIRPANGQLPQALLAHLDEGYSRFEHMPSALKLTSDGFQMRVWDDSLDFDNLFTRSRIYRFRTTGANSNGSSLSQTTPAISSTHGSSRHGLTHKIGLNNPPQHST